MSQGQAGAQFLGKVTLTLLCNNDKNIAPHFTLATLYHP